MAQGFDRRVYRVNQFFKDLAYVFARLPVIVGAYRSQRVPWPMAEKIMLCVTAVNDCRHCALFHGALARISGVEAEEVEKLLQAKIGKDVDAYERPALQFAQEYAQTEGRPTQANRAELKRFYGEEVARDIMLYIRMIMLGNLSGNTFDALLERWRGRPVGHSRPRDEIVIALLAAPFLACVSGFAAWQARQRPRG